MNNHDFATSLLAWYRQYGRHDLPWQLQRNPYRVWISEIMLQQTQVRTVIPYFNRFTREFPNITELAKAPLDDVLHIWTGLGYYARARNLHRCAQQITSKYQGEFPTQLETVMALPGIGRSTAGAILSLASGQRQLILDGNVKRVLTRCMAIHGWTGHKKTENQLWTLADQLTPDGDVADYNQAIMDLGATVCLRHNPACDACPLAQRCVANQTGAQHAFPESRPRKSLPLKKTMFVIMENKQGELLLQRRPPVGIWGGLWSFPECAPDTNIPEWVINELSYNVIALSELESIRHTFSHYHLDILPVHVRIDKPKAMIKETDAYCWYSLKQGQRLGLPAPVKALLERL